MPRRQNPHMHLFEAALGVKPQDMGKTVEILGVPLVDARAKFMVPAKFGDVVEMHSFIGEFRRSSFEVRHQIYVDGQLAVDGSETRVWAMLDEHGATDARLQELADTIIKTPATVHSG